MQVAISEAQRQAVESFGTPLSIVDEATHQFYVLLRVELVRDMEQDRRIAQVPGIAAYGEGDSEEEATLALLAALNGFIDAFGN